MRVLLIGAYGFIGSAVARALVTAGHDVTGLGRSAETGRRLIPAIDWIAGDLNHLTRPADWMEYLAGIDAVVNASGALQDGAGDRLSRIQSESIATLVAACEEAGVARFVQISAPGAVAGDASPFLDTKAVADDRLRGSSLHWAILRPGLVIGRNAYGGTLLIRALAALPVQALVHADRKVQTVAMDDVTQAVLSCLTPDASRGVDIDLVEADAHRLADIVARHRLWLGIAPARWGIDLPPALPTIPSRIADMLGHLGWRSPLRSTAMAMIARDVRGDPAGGTALLGRPLLGLDATLARHPSGLQDRWQARLVLLLPLLIGALALLFLLSGAIGLGRIDLVTAQLDGTPVAGTFARILGFAGSLADLALGGAILWRRTARPAALGMALLTLAYLLMGTMLRPDMWLDPLAPLAKAIPVMALALVAHALLEDR